MGFGKMIGALSGRQLLAPAGEMTGKKRGTRRSIRSRNRGSDFYFDFLEERMLLSFTGSYGALGFGGDSGSNQGSNTIQATIGASGVISADTLTSVGSGTGGTGKMRITETFLPDNGFSQDHDIVRGYATSDGSIGSAAVAKDDADQETSLVLFLKHGSHQSNLTLNGQYNAVLWDTPDGASFSSGLASVNFDGSGNADINITCRRTGPGPQEPRSPTGEKRFRLHRRIRWPVHAGRESGRLGEAR